MTVPIKFRKSSENVITSYDFVDIAEGTGVVAFYLAQQGTSSANSYLLTTNQVYSSFISIVNPGATTYDFDLTSFNLPKTVKGTAFLSMGIYMVASGGNTSVTVQIKKDSGGNVTDVSSAITGDYINGNGAHKMLLIPIPLTQTNFKRGDILRCSITMYGGGSGDEEIGTDPIGRNGTYITSAVTGPSMTTTSKLFIPFRIDT